MPPKGSVLFLDAHNGKAILQKAVDDIACKGNPDPQGALQSLGQLDVFASRLITTDDSSWPMRIDLAACMLGLV